MNKTTGPFRFELKVFITDGEDMQGTATHSMNLLEVPTEEDVEDAVGAVLETVGDEFRLMTPREIWEFEMYERTGERFAVPDVEPFTRDW